MVWGTLSRSLEDGTVSAAPVTDAGLDEGYPMYVLPIANFLSMSEWSCHQDLLRRGMLKQFDESMRGRVIFCSHQWCSYSHPDPGGDQLEALQGVLRKLAAGQMEPRGNGIVEHAFKLKIGRSAKEWTALLKDAYIWFGARHCRRGRRCRRGCPCHRGRRSIPPLALTSPAPASAAPGRFRVHAAAARQQGRDGRRRPRQR